MQSKLQKAKELTKKYNQQHLLDFYNELKEEQRENLINQILNIDFELMDRLYKNINSEQIETNQDIKPLKPEDWDNFSHADQNKLYQRGLDLIKEGKVAALLVAGGQGTRLGHNGPKGTYDIGLPSHKSLFQLQTERLLNLSLKCNRSIPWYIMTSLENHKDTVDCFENSNYFGYPKEDIFFFSQGLLPVVDEEGKILLSAKDSISMGPNGNGGCFLALKESGALKDMENKGIRWVFFYGVDNALVKVADPKFIGFADQRGADSASKAVAKNGPEERVGVICYKDKKPSVVEYSELSEDLANLRDQDGQLVFDNGNIANHLFKIDFLQRCTKTDLPYHVAHKKISTIDRQGNIINPSLPNAYKFELFMFDVFKYLDDMAVLRVKREEEFAPVKNKEGEDSPYTAVEFISNLHRQWLVNQGIDEEILKGKFVEISPLVSYDGEGLEDIIINTNDKNVVI